MTSTQAGDDEILTSLHERILPVDHRIYDSVPDIHLLGEIPVIETESDAIHIGTEKMEAWVRSPASRYDYISRVIGATLNEDRTIWTVEFSMAGD